MGRAPEPDNGTAGSRLGFFSGGVARATAADRSPDTSG